MAFPFKTGGDFYNCEALNMRLHNHSADLNEYGTGTIYFNTGSNTNHSKHAVVHDGTNFKALAFVDEIATNAEFVKLQEKVDLLIGDDVDTDTIIDSWKEVQAFLADIEDTKTLQGMLSSYLPKSGGTISGDLIIKKESGESALALGTNGAVIYNPTNDVISLYNGGSGYPALSVRAGLDHPVFRYNYQDYILIHSGNIGEYKAGGLAHSNGTIGAVVSSYGTLTIGASDKAGDGSKLYIDNNLRANSIQIGTTYTEGLNRATLALNPNLTTNAVHGVAHVFGADLSTCNAGNIVFRNIGGAGSVENIVSIGLYGKDDILCCNGNGNVLIGTTTDSGHKLQVNGNYRSISAYKQTEQIEHSVLIYPENPFGLITRISTKGYASLQSQRENGSETFNLALNPLGGNVLIGKIEDNGAKLQIKGDVYVDGNIIATKEVSAGGAGQEGESGDGGAEVISQQLASGQSTYTITNTIKRSDIAVSLYEWNANNSSWDMCLADISVKDATITVTFGSATSVNHKLVAVG